MQNNGLGLKFTTWTDWSGSVNLRKNAGAGTLSSSNVIYARYMRLDNVVFFTMEASFVAAGGSISLLATLPIQPSASFTRVWSYEFGLDAVSGGAPSLVQSTGSNLVVFYGNAGNYNIGSSSFFLNFHYAI